MSIPILESCRKRKRRPKIYNFHTFGDPGCPISPTGPFRDNIRVFLKECAEPEDYKMEAKAVMCTLLVIESNSFVLPLYTIEEDVKLSLQPFCDHCRCIGWSGNYISKRRYHMIIPSDGQWNKRLQGDVLDLQSHLLHGLIHCNGYGHLLCINGIEGGSKYLCGKEIMDLWDRICANLRARKVTVQDVSKKRSMDLRLLHGVAYGQSWFGRWGYQFCSGSFGVTEHQYNKAVEILSSRELDGIIQDFSETALSKDMKQIIRYYRGLSETQLINFRDLLKFVLTVKSCPCTQMRESMACTQKKQGMACMLKKQSMTGTASYFTTKSSIQVPLQKKTLLKDKCTKYRNFNSLACTLDSRWPKKRLEYAAEVIVDTLKRKEGDSSSQGGMTRQEVRDAARMHIGDTGLLDYVLKLMNNVIVGSQIVRRTVNPKSRILEFTINDLGNGVTPRGAGGQEAKIAADNLQTSTLVPGQDVYDDMVYLYTSVLLNYPDSKLMQSAAQILLHSKNFVKEWPFRDEADALLRFICRVTPQVFKLEHKLNRGLPPGEIVMVPLHATVLELKQAAESALRETYCIFENFILTEIEQLEELEDEDLLIGAIESAAELTVTGKVIDESSNQLRYEGGPDNWTVSCECGAQDDDGERMVACDICEVWQHTLCNGIEDCDVVPPFFACQRCCSSLVQSRSEPELAYESYDDLLMIQPVEGEAQLLYPMEMEY